MTTQNETEPQADLKQIANAIYDLLKPIDSESRMKVVRAALILLGEPAAIDGHRNG